MPLTVSVPLNTMLADLDESLRALLERELGTHGFGGVQVAFEAPAKDWSAKLSAPAVNLFLYDLRESREHRQIAWETQRDNGHTRELRPPLWVEASYAVTAWTRAVEDEHRLLSQLLAVLYAYPELPEDVLAGGLRDQVTQSYPLSTKVGQSREDGKADFWLAVGGQYKASLDYVVTLACEPGASLERGPEVRTQTIRARDPYGAPDAMLELHRIGGTVHDGEDRPVENAWVTLPDAGAWTSSGPDGRFRFDRLTAGSYRCLARAADGSEAEGTVTVPGSGVDLVLGAPARSRRAKRTR
ncbi:MAG: Pvc16 family protein [Solirubrobacterales bacterium]